ncbi:hypothetical protein EBX31_12635 [bacterium]|nr:hypothetical protein [bacterium]
MVSPKKGRSTKGGSPIRRTKYYEKNPSVEIIRHGRKGKGIHFLTPNHYSQQVAWMSHKKGKMIDAHVHHRVPRAITQTK